MTDIFTFPSIDTDPATIPVALTPRPAWTDKRVAATVEAFELRETQRNDDGGPRISIRGDRAELEIFRTSDSVRWTALDDRDEEPATETELPDRRAAAELADDFLAARGLRHKAAGVASVTRSYHSRIGAGNEVLTNHPVAAHVNYRFRFEGRPVFGPGAKMQVTFGGPDEPVQAYKFWREPERRDPLPTIGYERAVALLRDHPAFASMRKAGKAKIVFERAELGYYAFPARELQGMLVPVYRFEGATSGPEGENYRFARHVMAVELSPEVTKQSRLTTRHDLPPVFSA